MIDTETLNQPVEQSTNVQEIQQPEPQEQEQEVQTQAEQVQPAPKPAPILENNIRALREKAERIQRERDEMAARLRELESRQNGPEEDLSINIGADEIAEGKHLTKLQKQLKKQQEELLKTQQQTQAMLIETKLKSEHPDIDKVVTTDNLKSLSELYPEIAQTLNSSSDYYSKAKSAYTMIKKFGIHQEDVFASDRELARTNAAKPRPLASVSPQQADSPLSRANAFANGLTEELKAQLRKEMEESIRNL